MNSPDPREWPPGRWALTIAILIVVQLAAIFIFSKHSTAPRPSSPPLPNFTLLPGSLTSRRIASSFFASDPTLYSAASLHSFSGPAWLRVTPPPYTIPDPPKATNWLALDVTQLGLLPDLRNNPLEGSLADADIVSPSVEPLPAFLIDTPPNTQSVVHIEGPLASRALNLPPILLARPWPDTLRDSEIEIAVNNAGLVISARSLPLLRSGLILLGTGSTEERSALVEADRDALKLARQLRFAPTHDPAVAWGKLVIQWSTTAP